MSTTEKRFTQVVQDHPIYGPGCTWSCQCGTDFHAGGSNEDHVGKSLAADLRAQIPAVAFKGPGTSDADAFRAAAGRLDTGYDVGGGNVKAAVSRLLRWAAELLDDASALERAERAKTGWER